MTPQEVFALLAVAASFDNRKPDREAATSWTVALTGYRFEDCRDAIVQHYVESSDWLMPTHVIGRVKRIRAKRIDAHPHVNPPPGLTDAEERSWWLVVRSRIGDGEVFAQDAFRGELVKRDNIRELVQAATPRPARKAARS